MDGRDYRYIRHEVFHSAVHLAHPNPLSPVSDLAVQVRDLDCIAVHQANRPYTRPGQIRSSRTAQASDSHEQHFGRFQPQLAM